MEVLRHQKWIDLQTRTVRLLCTYYNPTVDLFCTVALVFDFLASGGVKTEYSFRTIDPQRHVAVLINSPIVRYFPPGAYDYVMLAVEGFFWLFVAYRLLGEFRWMCRAGCSQWITSIWHIIDLCNCICLMCIGFMRLLLMSIIGELNFVPSPDEFADFYTASNFMNLIQTFFSVSALLTYGKLIKYLQISPNISWVTRSFTQAQQHMVGQLVALVAIFNGYAMALHFSFGSELEEFSTMALAWNQMFTIMIGEFDYASYKETGSIVGPYLFMSFMTLYLLIIFNMVIAIMERAFDEAREQPDTRTRRAWRTRPSPSAAAGPPRCRALARMTI
eukprot:1016008-Prymnesium_polylepis.1